MNEEELKLIDEAIEDATVYCNGKKRLIDLKEKLLQIQKKWRKWFNK